MQAVGHPSPQLLQNLAFVRVHQEARANSQEPTANRQEPSVKHLWRAFKLVLPHRGMLALYVVTAIGLAIFNGSYVVLGKSYLDGLGTDAVPHDKLGKFV